MAPATSPEVDRHYSSISDCPLSSGGKDNLDTSIFHLHPQGFIVFLDSAQVLAFSVIHAYMEE